MPQSNRVDLSVYEDLLAMNTGFEQVCRALTALGQERGFERGEIARFREIAEEAETVEAGRLYRRRLARERNGERSGKDQR